MTAPGRGGADEIRDQLAAALAGHQGLVGPRDQERPSVWFRWCICGWDGGPLAAGEASNDGRSYRAHLADVLAPIAEARVQAAAEGAVERAAQAVEALRPHIPPSTDPNRRTSVIVRSTLNRAARAVRAAALAEPAPGPP